MKIVDAGFYINPLEMKSREMSTNSNRGDYLGKKIKTINLRAGVLMQS